jgi:hypothetical protein
MTKIYDSKGVYVGDEPDKDEDELALENTIKALIDRVHEAREGSAEHGEALRQLTHLLDSDDRAGVIAEEYQSLLLPSTSTSAQ